MTETCGRVLFRQYGSIMDPPIGHCGLPKGHDGYPENCSIRTEDGEVVETSTEPIADVTKHPSYNPKTDWAWGMGPAPDIVIEDVDEDDGIPVDADGVPIIPPTSEED